MNPVWNPPAYLLTVPQVVPAHSDDETSEGEEPENTFSEKDFKNPPFEIDWTARGKVCEQDELSNEPPSPYESQFIKKVERESFGKDRDQVKKRVGIVIGYNRMRSLSNSVNRRLIEQSNTYASNPVLNREIHFFWLPRWIDSKTGMEVEWSVVRSFYRQLKKRSPQKAQCFRREREGLTQVTEKTLEQFFKTYNKTKMTSEEFFRQQDVPRFTRDHIRSFEKKLRQKAVADVAGYVKLLKRTFMIPYREIRERIIRHKKTKECAEQLQQAKKRPLYMAFQDSDVESMDRVFSNYDISLREHLKRRKMLPEVASGGYQVKDPLNPILEIGVLIDLWVRHFTAQFFPLGVYYPEPNTLVRINEGETTLEASFLGVGSYTSPQEMPTLISDLIKKRNIQNLSGAFLFDARAALTTAVPKRMQRRFQAFYTRQQKVVRWGLSDLKIYKGVSQTHYSNRSWAINLCDAAGVPDQIKLKGGQILTKQNLRNIAISLIARLFSSYDPFEVARRNGPGFQRSMITLLKDYQPEALPLAPKETRIKSGPLERIWRKVDGIKDMATLLKTIDFFLKSPGTGRKIQLAAEQSMKAVVQIFKENLSLNFTELSIAAMMSLEKPRDAIEEMRRHLHPLHILDPNEIGSPVHQAVLETMVEPDWKGKLEFKKMVKELPRTERTGYLQTTPMHWAAITGNLEAVRYLQSCKGWISSIDRPGEMGLLPLHCALRYCADNGEDLDLIRELATKELVTCKEVRDADGYLDHLIGWTRSKVMRESPLLQALQDLYAYPETLKLLFQIAEVDRDVKKELLELARQMTEDSEGELEPKKIIGLAIRQNCSPDTIALLIEWGAEFQTCADDLERGSPFAVAIEEDYGSQAERLALIDILASSGYNLLLEDDEGLTPLAYAIEQQNLPVVEKLVEMLLPLGWEPTEEETRQIERLRQMGIGERRDEPIDEQMVDQLDEVIRNLHQAVNLTPKEKSRMILRFEELKERAFYYDDNCFGNQMRLARKRKLSEN